MKKQESNNQKISSYLRGGKIEIPSEFIESFRVELLMEAILGRTTEDALRTHIHQASRRKYTPELISVLEQWLLLNVAKIPEIPCLISFSSGDYTFKQVTTFSEFVEIGHEFNNCLYSWDDYVDSAIETPLVSIFDEKKRFGLVSIKLKTPFMFDILPVHGRKNSSIDNEMEVIELLANHMESLGYKRCKLIQDRGRNRIERHNRWINFRRNNEVEAILRACRNED